MNASSRYLRIATSATILMGLAVALGGIFPEALGFEALARGLFWPHPPEGGMGDIARLNTGVAGGVLTGFGVAMDRLTRLRDGASRGDIADALLVGLLAWFVVDSSASALIGATLNVVGNAICLALIAPPFLALRRRSQRRATA